jgi:hypothetical protein
VKNVIKPYNLGNKTKVIFISLFSFITITFLILLTLKLQLLKNTNKQESSQNQEDIDLLSNPSNFEENTPGSSSHQYEISDQTAFEKLFAFLDEKEDSEENADQSQITNDTPSNNENQTNEETSAPEPAPPPPPSSCPQTTLSCVPCTPGELYCRYETGATTGYLGWACQNNNPSNIRDSSYRSNLITQMGGPAPCGGKGGYLVFSTYAQGREGVKAYIRAINAGMHSAYITAEFSCGDCTLLQFVSKYAPNNYENYTNGIVNKMGGGVTPETKLNWIVANRLENFVDAIQCMEGYFIYSGGVAIKWCNL